MGFETTAPANGLSILHARQYGLRNFSLFCSHVLVPPAMEGVINDPESEIHGFLGAGNVCSVMGLDPYRKLVDTYKIPLVVTGFEPVDLLQGILMTIIQLEAGSYRLENQYSRVVPEEGNPHARRVIDQIFEVTDREWRGIGVLPNSGLKIRSAFAAYDATAKFGIGPEPVREEELCLAGEILTGRKKPVECPHFGKGCTPVTPIGAPMVSSEGACAAYYHFASGTELAR